jgi:multicomponent Na+:H+ antiporter subunit G
VTALELAGLALVLVGCAFYGAGTVGLVRFPDVYSRLHALTKADNQGLLFVVLGLALLAGSWRVALLLLVIWLVGLLAAAVLAHLIARHARHESVANVSREEAS